LEWKERAFALLASGQTRKEVVWTLNKEGFKTNIGREITLNSVAALVNHERILKRKREYFERIAKRSKVEAFRSSEWT